MKTYMVSFAKAMILGYIISAAAVGVLAFLLYQWDIQENQIHIGMLMTYVFACLCGGIYIGRKTKRRQFLWGLFVGLLYFSVHMAGVAALEGISPERIVPMTSLAVLCMGSGVMGGMLGCDT